MGVLLIIAGIVIAVFGARMFRNDHAEGGQSTLGGLFTLLLQLGGIALVIWGISRFF